MAPELVAELGEPWGGVWQLLSGAHGEREAARVLARLLGAVCQHGEDKVARAFAAALNEQRVGLLDLAADDGLPPPAITVPPRAGGLRSRGRPGRRLRPPAAQPQEAPMSNPALEAVISRALPGTQARRRRARVSGAVPARPGRRQALREEFLHELLEAEVISRRQSTARRLLREARLPDVKTLDQVDWQALKGVAKPVPRRATTKPITAPPPRRPAARKRRTKPKDPYPINPTGWLSFRASPGSGLKRCKEGGRDNPANSAGGEFAARGGAARKRARCPPGGGCIGRPPVGSCRPCRRPPEAVLRRFNNKPIPRPSRFRWFKLVTPR